MEIPPSWAAELGAAERIDASELRAWAWHGPRRACAAGRGWLA